MATTEEPGGDHARGAVLLSGVRPRRNAVSPSLGVTIDQLIANKYGRDTILSSIQLGVEDIGNFGNWVSMGAGMDRRTTAINRTISPTTPR
jgi:hypothetical protein